MTPLPRAAADGHDAPTPAELRGLPRASYARSHQMPLERAERRSATARKQNPTPRAYNAAGGHEKPVQTEKAFQAQVVALARLRGWREYHTYDSRKSASGFPDLVLARPPRVLFVELKRQTGTISPAQRAWLQVLGCCSVESYCWRPSDWDVLDAILT